MASILVIEDEENLRFSIRRRLEKAGHDVAEAVGLREAGAAVESGEFDLIIVDVMLGSENGLTFVREQREAGNRSMIVVVTAFGTVENAVEAMRSGADDYLQKPISLEELTIQAERWLDSRRAARRLELFERIESMRNSEEQALGSSEAWRRTVETASRLARIPIGAPNSGASLPCILILGETGAGKGVLARLLHDRAAEEAGEGQTPPFVHVNCSALPATLVESELFGHERGAFTDARETREGLFEMADGGTIFLDEISEMPLELQAKLLLVVERGVFRRVGGAKERSVRVRVVAASNQDLSRRAEEGHFRKDLLFRLNAFTIRIPSLRERGADAEEIAEAMLRRVARQFGQGPKVLNSAAREAIRAHDWPGNVRELVNCVQRAVMLSEGRTVTPESLGLTAQDAPDPVDEPRGAARGNEPVFDFVNGPHTAEAVERQLIIQALEHTGGNVSAAAKLIGMQRSSLRYRMDRYGLNTDAGRALG